MDMNGLLIDYEWCTGCHTCEIACQQEHGFAPRNVLEKGKVGISPYEIGPHDLGNGRFQYEFLPVPTALCDLCADRTDAGKMPMCVQHCQAWCLQFGEVEGLVGEIDGTYRHALLVR